MTSPRSKLFLPGRPTRIGGTRPARRLTFCPGGNKKQAKIAFPCGGHPFASLQSFEQPLHHPRLSALRGDNRVSDQRLSAPYCSATPFCVVRGSGVLKAEKTWQRRSSLRIEHAGTTTTLCRWSKRRRAVPTSPRATRMLRPPRPHAGGSPGSFGYFSKPNQKSNSSGGTRPADFKSSLAPHFQRGNLLS